VKLATPFLIDPREKGGLALTTGAKVVPVAHWGAPILWPYGTKKFRPFPRATVEHRAGEPIDLSAYRGQPHPPSAATLRDVTDIVMREVTTLLADVRGEQPPALRDTGQADGA
jgi:1-acyl-sn-glycerol-3-phosphate acyltransferase